MFQLLRVVGSAVVKNFVTYLLEDNPVVKLAHGICGDVYQGWKALRPVEAERRADLQAIASAPAEEVQRQAAAVVRELTATHPQLTPKAQAALTGYLEQLPGVVRRTLTRRDDPSGKTVPPALRLDTPEDVETLLPTHLPRFSRGSKPVGIGDWELVELLGVGGFGEVWKARNPYRPKAEPAALKFCLDPSAKERLLRHEAQVVAQVRDEGKHPGIVALQHTYLGADPPCLEYEFVNGGDLAGYALRWHQAKPPFPDTVAWAARLVYSLATIVGFAHRLEPPVVHRDLKPANILLQVRADNKFDLRIADFGIGLVAGVQALEQTRKGSTISQAPPNTVLGSYTPLYASPQQINRAPADPRDDVHALGVIWYQLLTADFRLGAPTGLWARNLERAGMPVTQIELLGECVSIVAEDRPSDARVLADRLKPLLAATTVATTGPVVGSPPKPTTGPVVATAVVATDDPAERARRELEAIRKANADAAQAESLFDYHGGLRILNGLDERLRKTRHFDAALYQRLADTLKTIADLERGIAADAGNLDFTRGLARRIHELLALKPDHAHRKYLDLCPVELKRGQLEHLDLGRGVKCGFVWLPEGSFWLSGTTQTQIAEGFALGVHPVTQEQWQAVMGDNPSYFSRNGGGKDKVKGISDADLRLFPVEQVSHDDVQRFLQKINEKERNSGWTYRLPTEAEWEYACREGANVKEACGFNFYLDKPTNDLSSKQANFDGNHPAGSASKGPYLDRTTKVGSYAANRLGLFDMHGNVWEWCSDWHTQGSYRVFRGGGWIRHGSNCPAGYRIRRAPSERDSTSVSASPEFCPAVSSESEHLRSPERRLGGQSRSAVAAERRRSGDEARRAGARGEAGVSGGGKDNAPRGVQGLRPWRATRAF